LPPVGLLMEPNKLNLHLTVELMIQRRRSPLGRFLPRLGPFVPRTAYFSAHQSEPATGLTAELLDSGYAALQKMHLKIVRRTLSFCDATSRASLVMS